MKLYLLIILFIGSITSFANDSYRKITVAKDGSADYTSIQEAINSTRDLGPDWVEIFVKNGIYNEKINIPSWKHLLHIKGEDQNKTIITNDDYSGKINPLTNSKLNTFESFTLMVAGDNVMLENITIQNTSCNQGQAVALHVEGDLFIAKNVTLKGCQDTLYTATNHSRQYYYNCYIEGTTDFIFGQATAVFDNCEIKSLSNSYITAAATGKNKNYGFVFFNCHLTANDQATEVYLGRPWRPFAKTVYINTKMEKHILPIGWDEWKGDAMFPDKEKTAFYAEYQSTGQGSKHHQRAKWSKQLSKQEIKLYTLDLIFNGWNPKLYVE